MGLRRIIQQDRNGCGLACVAMLAGISYRQACAIAEQRGWYADIRKNGMPTHRLRKLLRDSGVRTNPAVRTSRWERFSDLAIVCTNSHWAVFQRNKAGVERVFDSNASLKNGIRTDFSRIRPVFYIEVISDVDG